MNFSEELEGKLEKLNYKYIENLKQWSRRPNWWQYGTSEITIKELKGNTLIGFGFNPWKDKNEWIEDRKKELRKLGYKTKIKEV